MSQSLERIRHATPAELRRAADVDLWRGGAAGAAARFDADRFGEWLEVLVEAGADVTARQLVAMDVDLVVLGIAEHVRVFDAAARPADERPDEVELGGYVIVPRRGESCQPVLDALGIVHDENPRHFHRLMAGCRGLSNEGSEPDGLHNLLDEREQARLDVTIARERRREQQGYVSAEDARAFLSAPPEARRALFRAHRRDRSDAPPAEAGVSATTSPRAPTDRDAASPARALLSAGADEPPARALRLYARLERLRTTDADAFERRVEELGFLANALAAACSVQDRGLTAVEASAAAAAVCNIALEHQADTGKAVAPTEDCLTLFDEGWQLYRRVCREAATELLDTLGRLRCRDPHVQVGLDDLRKSLSRHQRDGAPWRAREALDTLTALDLPTWAGLLGLIAECPVVHAAIPAIVDRRRVAIDPQAFEFISETRQLAAVRLFLRRLPDLLTGA